MQVYLVGGAVRDELLGLNVHEHDWVVVGTTPKQMREQGFSQVGNAFPVFLHPQSKDEYALARKERKEGEGYTGFICDFSPDISLQEDLLRRDLTVNAIAKDQSGQLIDPYGGQQDLQKRVLRHVSDAFVEDPLRVLRVARFAARFDSLGFQVADETMALMREIVASGELDALTPERVWKETEKALSTDSPQRYFQVLRDCDALQALFPEVEAMFGVPNPPKWHPEIDTGIHTLMVLEQAAKLTPSIEIRFAALCHDFGKALTPKDRWPSHPGHEHTGLPVIEAFCERWRVPSSHRDAALMLCRFHSHCHKLHQLKSSTVLKLLDGLDAWRKPERLENFILGCTADFKGRTGYENQSYPQAEMLRRAYQAAAAIDVKPIVAAGFKGPNIREELNKQRVAAIQQLEIRQI